MFQKMYIINKYSLCPLDLSRLRLLPQLSNSIVDLGSKTFEKCNSLNEIYIPNNVKQIYENCFYKCQNLNKIHVSKNINNDTVWFDKCDNLNEIIFY